MRKIFPAPIQGFRSLAIPVVDQKNNSKIKSMFQIKKNTQGDHVKSLQLVTAIFGLVLSLSAFAGHGGYNGPGNNRGGGQVNQPNQPSTPQGSVPSCMDRGQALSVDNEKAIQLRSQQQSGFQTRLLIAGTVDQVFPDHNGHRHFSVKIGPNPDDHIEVIYNLSFGSLPVPTVGETAEACGDYIVSTSQNGGYAASPDGMIIHWVHRSTGGHEAGFTMLNGQIYQ